MLGRMAKPANPIPPGFHTLTLHINVNGAAAYSFTWALATRKEELTPEEMQQRQQQAFSSGGGA